MLKTRSYFAFLFAVWSVLGLYGCIRSTEFPDTPKIRFADMNKNILNQLTDTLTIRFDFEDGGADLGFNNTDTSNCDICDTDTSSASSCFNHPTWSIFVVDLRDSCLAQIRNIPFIDVENGDDNISGSISVDLFSICCKNTRFPCSTEEGAVDTLSYQIFIRDRAGNRSNKIETPPILVQCSSSNT